jgi:hypothetical protein
MVAWPGRSLYKWHTDTDTATPELEADQNARARLEHDPVTKRWFLVNLALPDIVVLDNAQGLVPVPPGQKVELKPDMRILFGPPPQYRMAYVQIVKVT